MRPLRLYSDYDPVDGTDRRTRLVLLRRELVLTRRELAKKEPRVEILNRHKRHLLKMISEMENWPHD